MKIKKGDKVYVLSGKDKGRQAVVTRILPKKIQAFVGGINIYKKHVKAQANQAGGIIEIEKPLHLSKLQLVCPNCKKRTRVAYQVDKSGHKLRICRKCKSIIDKLDK